MQWAQLSSLGQASLRLTAASAVLLGIMTHQAVRPFELDARGHQLVIIYMTANVAVFVAYATQHNFSLPDALGRTSLVATAFNAGLWGSIFLYRAFFHRLRRFPGPFPAKISRFWAASRAYKEHRLAMEFEKLHKQYGDVVRVGPCELSINRPSAIPLVYGPRSRCTKSTFYTSSTAGRNLNQVRDIETAKHRKKVWERALSMRALSVYEPRVRSEVDVLLSKLEASKDKAINVTDYSMFFGFDVVGQVGFGKNFEMMSSGKEAPAVAAIHGLTKFIAVVYMVPWVMPMLAKLIRRRSSARIALEAWLRTQLTRIQATFESEKSNLGDQDPGDVMTWLIREKDKYEHDKDRRAPDPPEDAVLLIIAGSDTTSAALTNCLFYLTKDQSRYRELQKAMRNAVPGGHADWAYDKVHTNQVLENVILETLRLKPSGPGGPPRVVPAGGLKIDELFIPEGIHVHVPTWTIQRDPRHWDRPLEWLPERWDKLHPDTVPFIPFSRGARACPGRQLAMMEMRSVISRIALQFDLAFPPGFDADAFDNGALDAFTMALPPLPIIFTPVEA